MAPKKKKGKKGKKGKEEPEPEDHYMTMKGDQLEITIANLKEKLQDAKIKRNMLQIEKDMIHDFYHNTREEIKECLVSLKCKNSEAFDKIPQRTLLDGAEILVDPLSNQFDKIYH